MRKGAGEDPEGRQVCVPVSCTPGPLAMLVPGTWDSFTMAGTWLLLNPQPGPNPATKS